jgi:hypothetical protein
MVTNDFVMEQFGEEINLIEDSIIKNLVVKALMNTPQAFYEEGASSTGKYHPAYAQGKGGLVRHEKAAVYFAKNLTSLEMYELSQIQKDKIYAALILHDTCKRGLTWDKSYTVHDHPLLVRELLPIEEMDIYEEMYWEEINELISTHMGQWVTGRGSKTVLPKPQTKEQQLVHLCDYLASRKEVDVDIFGLNEPTETVNPVVIPKAATESQKKYVAVLINKARKLPNYDPKFNDVEVEDMTQGFASRVICELREILGE